MGIFDEIFDNKKKKEPSEIDNIFKQKPTVGQSVANKQFQNIENEDLEAKRLDLARQYESNGNDYNEDFEDDVEDETMDFNALATVGTSIEIGGYLGSDDEITIYVEPSKIDNSGWVRITRKVTDEDNGEVKEVSEITREGYQQTNVEDLKQKIKTVVKMVKKLLVDEDAAYKTLNDYLDEIEDELNE
jgi:hypothetical protein